VVTTPNWQPLERIYTTTGDLGAWMWMDRVTSGGVTVEQYKHIATRRYLNLDGAGNAYRVVYDDGGWTPWDGTPVPLTPAPTLVRVPLADALDWALS
jgi:hypothetical protein